MTLAVAILLFSISAPTSVSPGATAQSTAAPSPDNQLPAPQQEKSLDAAKPAIPSAKSQRATAKKARRRKKIVSSACDPALNASSSASTNPPAGSATQGAAPPSTNTPEPPKNCPPPKIIVRQGGITEQSIQLAGGPADHAAQKRDAASQMLAATEDNLKKLTGRQFSAAQEDSISQIRQFLDQSKSAMAAGNVERAQTLAWKAKVLSEDLIKPEQ